jgi:hypothetical protein
VKFEDGRIGSVSADLRIAELDSFHASGMAA